MSRSCSVCEQFGVADINAQLVDGKSVREVARTFGIPRATLGRHVEHIKVGHPADSGSPSSDSGSLPGSHLTAACDLIAAVKALRGDKHCAQDVAEAKHFTTLAELVDSNPTNVSALREYRLTIAEYRRIAAPVDDEDEAYAELMAKLSGWGASVEASSRVYSAAIERGLSPAEARSIADAVDEC